MFQLSNTNVELIINSTPGMSKVIGRKGRRSAINATGLDGGAGVTLSYNQQQ